MEPNQQHINAERERFLAYLGSRGIGRTTAAETLGNGLDKFVSELAKLHEMGETALTTARETKDGYAVVNPLVKMRLQRDRAYASLFEALGGAEALFTLPQPILSAVGDYTRQKYEGIENACMLHVR
ncbi:hypothetical protein C4580_02780 [Candidatus Woesearchaeota archaeon]|nr:MAG: hypothetical protein C4580_02780 [Candidatus Woesearchaeota archaeon]